VKSEHVMKVVVSVVKFIRSRGLIIASFSLFLSEIGAECGDVLYRTEVRCLSRERMLRHFIA
jgi:hypothetical protein